MIYTQTEQYDTIVNGHHGRPAHYPEIEYYPDLLFYIQRNQNTNTVVYEANIMSGGLLNLNEPIKLKWIKFEKEGKMEVQELNDIQKKLAYGYHFRVISNDLVEFCFVSYNAMKFFIFRDRDRNFRVSTLINEALSVIDKIYIYAEDMGIFPQVKFAEFFCKDQKTKAPIYKKLSLQ